MNAVGQLLADTLTYPFLRRAFAAALAAAVVCAVLSCWLVLTGWSLLGDAVSHAVLPGVVLSYILGLPFALGATVFGLLAVWLIGGLRRISRVKEDASIGIVFTTLFALGLVLVSVTPSQVDLHHIVFANLLGVSRTDLAQVLVLAAACLTVLLIRRRDLTLWAFDPRHARVVGLNPRVLAGILLGCLALTCVVAMQTVGVVLVVAMLVIPGATAQLRTRRFPRMLGIAVASSLVCTVTGLYLSVALDASSGGCVVLCQGIWFAVVYALTRVRTLRHSRPASAQ
ncbi:metal ABC transporter permease [Rothia sp. BD8]